VNNNQHHTDKKVVYKLIYSGLKFNCQRQNWWERIGLLPPPDKTLCVEQGVLTGGSTNPFLLSAVQPDTLWVSRLAVLVYHKAAKDNVQANTYLYGANLVRVSHRRCPSGNYPKQCRNRTATSVT